MTATKPIGVVRVEITSRDKGSMRILRDTINLFRDAHAYMVHVSCDNWQSFIEASSYDEVGIMERLIHHTKDNPSPVYKDFDTLYCKLPSDIRRACIHSAVGHVRSHETRCDEYYESRDTEIARGHHYTKIEPRFTYTPNACPTLYKKNVFTLEENRLRIKARVRNTWDWVELRVSNRDIKSLRRAQNTGTVMNPKLVYAYHSFYLEFPVKYRKTPMPEDVPLEEQTVLAVDRGFNHSAVCSVLDAYGTVLKRAFDPFGADMDRIDHVLGLIRKKSASSGKGQRLSSLYTKLEGLKDNHVKQTARWIVNLAKESGCYGIVLEHLESARRRKGKKQRGRLRERVQHWCTAKMRDYIRGMAYREGIRIFIVNPAGTSANAFDGSGPVVRDGDNYSLCTFSNGKRYNADLSASYNIGARYFLRSIKKSIPETEWSKLKAEVPELSRRTDWTLSTLWDVMNIMTERRAA